MEFIAVQKLRGSAQGKIVWAYTGAVTQGDRVGATALARVRTGARAATRGCHHPSAAVARMHIIGGVRSSSCLQGAPCGHDVQRV